MGGGGGSSSSTQIDPRSPSEEKGTIKNWDLFQQNQLKSYVAGSPLLSAAQTGATDVWSALAPNILPIIKSGGALTPEQNRNVTQQTDAAFASRGNLMGNQAIGAELLNRDTATQQRLQTALGESTTGLNQLIGTQEAETGTYAQLTNPVLSYLGGLFGGNQQAQISQAQIAAQQQAANQSKSAGVAGGATSAIAEIAPIALAAFSDKNLKEKIKSTGKKTPEGIPVKEFSYRGDKRRFRGVIAQDVEKVKPEAVMTLPLTGHKLVDLSQISPIFQEIKET